MQYKKRLIGTITLFLVINTGCKRLVEVREPEVGIRRARIFSNDADAQAAVVDMYVQMQQDGAFTNGQGSKSAALYADELAPADVAFGADQQFYSLQLLPANPVVKSCWSRAYTVIYMANAILEGLASAAAVTDTLRQQMIGEAYFVRALHYFYLVNCFGGVPLSLSTEYYATRNLPRSGVEEVYGQVKKDLQAAVSRLPASYARTDTTIPGNIRPTRWAAMALLARVHLYQQDWSAARQMASQVITAGAFALPRVDSVFLVRSPEIIFQLQPVRQHANSAEAALFLVARGMPPYAAANSWLARLEPQDARKTTWLGLYSQDAKTFFYPFKYRQLSGTPAKEYTVALRLAEAYLIRAEVNAQLGVLTGAMEDVNKLRARAQLPPLPLNTPLPQLLAAIEQERAVEFWTEWGHRFFDLRRWPGRSNPELSRFQEVMQIQKPGLQPYRELWPIPADQLTLNTGWQQNPGY